MSSRSGDGRRVKRKVVNSIKSSSCGSASTSSSKKRQKRKTTESDESGDSPDHEDRDQEEESNEEEEGRRHAEFLDRLEDQCLRHIRKSAEQDTTIFKGYVTTVALGMLTKVWPKGSSPFALQNQEGDGSNARLPAKQASGMSTVVSAAAFRLVPYAGAVGGRDNANGEVLRRLCQVMVQHSYPESDISAKRWGRIFTPNKSKVHGDGRIAVVTAVRGIWDDIVPEYQHAVENGAPLTTDTILDKMKEELPRPKQGGDKQWIKDMATETFGRILKSHTRSDASTWTITDLFGSSGYQRFWLHVGQPLCMTVLVGLSDRLINLATAGCVNDDMSQGSTASPRAAPFVEFDVKSKSDEFLDRFEGLGSGGVVDTKQGVLTGSCAAREFQHKFFNCLLRYSTDANFNMDPLRQLKTYEETTLFFAKYIKD